MASNNGSIGTYSVSVKSFFTSWKDKNNKRAEAEKKSKKTIKPIVNPIFETCTELISDPYWQGIFRDCARGKFPRGFSYKNGLINYRKGSKMIRLEVSKSPPEALQEVRDFFQKMAGLLSDEDRSRMKRLEEEQLLEQSCQQFESWKDVKGDKLKDILISEFITDMCLKYDLDENAKRELFTNVRKGFMLKCFGAQNIEMENGRIVEIEGLSIDRETGESEIDPEMIHHKSARTFNGLGLEITIEKPQVDFLDGWSKYLSGLENKRTKNTQTYSFSTRNEDDSTNSYM